MERKLSVDWRLMVLALLLLLDIRDLYFKSQWLGSDDTYRFSSTSIERLLSPSSLHLKPNASDTSIHTSGWRSFLQACDGLDGFQGTYFLHARLQNCTVGAHAETSIRLVPELLVSSGIRADSMAWAACQMLYIHRRPPLCHENIVLEFIRRYAMAYPPQLPRSAMLLPMSDAEAEALHLLDVISQSAPLSAIVCVEGFEYTGSKAVTPATLFACASPTVDQVAFIGEHATSFALLHRKLAWLTVYDLNVLGMHFVVRQNAISLFSVVDARVDHQAMTLVHESTVNVSSSGVLYHLMIGVDLLLLLVHGLSALELAVLVTWRSESLKRNGGDVGKLSIGFFAISLYRSTPVIVLTVLSHLLSWILLLPLSVVLSWSESVPSQLHAILTMVRVWVLVLLMLRAVWHCVLVTHESLAYKIAQRTFVSVFEVVIATALAMVILHRHLSGVREQNYNLDTQRLRDATTFDGIAVISNAYHDEQDYFPLASRASTLLLLYIQLVYVVCLSFGFIILVLCGRFVYFKQFSPPNGGSYARIPAEDLLDTPIRAEQLVRSRLSIEVLSPGQKWLRPEQFLEHGVVLEDGKYLHTRQGFLGVAKPKIFIDDNHDAVGARGYLDSPRRDNGAVNIKHEDPLTADSPTKKRRMSAHIPSLR